MSSAHYAQGGGLTKIFTDTPTVSASPNYTDGDNMGGLITLTNFGRPTNTDASSPTVFSSGIIQSVVITNLVAGSLNIDVLFFDTNPSNTTFTDNGALTVNDTDLLTLIGLASVTTWSAFADNEMGYESNLGIPFNLEAGNASMYVALVARGAHNLASTSDLTLRVGTLLD